MPAGVPDADTGELCALLDQLDAEVTAFRGDLDAAVESDVLALALRVLPLSVIAPVGEPTRRRVLGLQRQAVRLARDNAALRERALQAREHSRHVTAWRRQREAAGR